MDRDIDGLRRRERELEAELAAVRADLGAAVPASERTERATLDLLAAAFEASRVPMAVSDPNLPDNLIVLVNRAFLKLSGYPAGEVVGRNCRFLQGPGTDPADVARIRDAVTARREVVVELLNYRRDGSPFRNEFHLKPVTAPDGTLRYFYGSQFDVTARDEAEARLAASEARYHALF